MTFLAGVAVDEGKEEVEEVEGPAVNCSKVVELAVDRLL